MIVVAAIDGSEHTHKVVEAAKQYAGDGDIHFVYVATPYVYPYVVASGAMVDFESLRSAMIDDVWKTVGRLPANATATTLEWAGGPAAKNIVEYAKNVGADLIVAGSRGRGAFKSLLLGSVSHGIAHASDRDVLIVK